MLTVSDGEHTSKPLQIALFFCYTPLVPFVIEFGELLFAISVAGFKGAASPFGGMGSPHLPPRRRWGGKKNV